MLYNILKQCSPTELAAMADQDIPEDVKSKMISEGVIGTKDAAGPESSGEKFKRKLQLKNKI
jgi:hypothetical protein